MVAVGASMLYAVTGRRASGPAVTGAHSHGPWGGLGGHRHTHDRTHDVAHEHHHGHGPGASALVVLLAAIGLGRTAFGILLVAAYGAGMAATLAGAGLLLVVVQRRLARAMAHSRSGVLGRQFSRAALRVQAATPATTAALVLVVGAGLAARAAASLL